MANGIFMGWNRPFPDREKAASELFTEVVGWLGQQQGAGKIKGFEPVLVSPHGGDMNGFFIIRGTDAQMSALRADEKFIDLTTRANYCLTGFGVIDAWVEDEIQNMMQRWMKLIA